MCHHIRRCVCTNFQRVWSVNCLREKPHSGRNYQHSCLTIKPSLFSPIIVKRVGHTQSLRTTYKQARTSLEAAGKIIDNQFHASTAANFHTSLSMSLILRDNFSLSLSMPSWRQQSVANMPVVVLGWKSSFRSLIKLFFVLLASLSIFKCFSFLRN